MTERTTFPRSLPGQPIDLFVECTEMIEPFEVDDALVEQFHQLLPSVAYLAIAMIPFGEKIAKKAQTFLNREFPENLR